MGILGADSRHSCDDWCRPGCSSISVVQFWERAKDSPVRRAIEKGFAPLTVGLVLASGYVMSKAADQDWRAYLAHRRLHAHFCPYQDKSTDRGRNRGLSGLVGSCLRRGPQIVERPIGVSGRRISGRFCGWQILVVASRASWTSSRSRL